MKTSFTFYIILFLCSFLFIILSCNDQTPKETASMGLAGNPNRDELIKRGAHLVTIMGCNDCHSPKQMGEHGPELIPDKILSGYPSDRPIVKFDSPLIKEGFAMFYPDLTAGAGPWGISFAANLTPDDTGIGNWTAEQFRKALTEGKHKGLDGTRALLPPMPWENYKTLSEDETQAMFSYLMSINPVKNNVPAPISPENM